MAEGMRVIQFCLGPPTTDPTPPCPCNPHHIHITRRVSHTLIYKAGVDFHQKQETHRHLTSGRVLEMLTTYHTTFCSTYFRETEGPASRKTMLCALLLNPRPGFNQAIVSDLTSDPSDCTILSNMLLPKKTLRLRLVRLGRNSGSINPALYFTA